VLAVAPPAREVDGPRRPGGTVYAASTAFFHRARWASRSVGFIFGSKRLPTFQRVTETNHVSRVG
jgi:hypothetical protein